MIISGLSSWNQQAAFLQHKGGLAVALMCISLSDGFEPSFSVHIGYLYALFSETVKTVVYLYPWPVSRPQ